MKKLTLIITFAIISASMFSQARKPEIMVVPSDVWCNSKGYIQTYDNQGLVEQIPDYKKAVKTDKELSNMIGKISNMMADRGFPLVDLSATISSIERRQAEDELITSKQGAAIAESPLDQLRRTAKADIILSLDWTVNENGPKRSVTYNLQGLDAYTNKVIAGVQGTGNPSLTADTAVLLEEAVGSNMDNFTSRLQDYFDDLFANGREVVVTVRVFDNSAGIDLDSEYDGYLLSEIIDEWMADNTVNSRFGKSDATETYINYHQVRIPLYTEKGRPMVPEMSVANLARYLRRAPYTIPSKEMMRGLGEAILILGDK